MKKKVATYIARQQLIEPGSKVLVALSGGADSVALLRILLSLGYVCEAAHCNFCLRGTESERDETFVRQLCQEQTVPLHVIHFDTTGEASRKHISIEMAARELRYTWFEQVRQACGAYHKLTATHHGTS